MADTPAQQLARLQAQLVTLDRAMSSGVLTVEGADGTGRITYRSYPEMQQARAGLVRNIAAAKAATGVAVVPRIRQVVMTGRSGW